MLYNLGNSRVKLCGENFVAENATVIGAVELGYQSSVWFNVVIRADNDTVTIGERSNVQDGSVLHVDPGYPMTIGNGVTIGHKVMLHGCDIGAGSLIGINSVILNATKIGKNCLIGANTLIAEGKTIPDGSLVIGSPGRVVRKLSEVEIARVHEAAKHYVDNGRRYQSELKSFET